MNNVNTIEINGYHNDFRVRLTLDSNADQNTINNLLAKIALAQTCGVTAQLAGLEPGEKKVTIYRVVRRQWNKRSDGQIAQVIDMYKDYGEFREGYMYMDTAEDIAQFELQSGLKFDQLPVYESQTAIQLAPNVQNRHVVNVKTPFDFVKKQKDEVMANGNPTYEYRYFNEIGNATDIQHQPTNVIEHDFTDAPKPTQPEPAAAPADNGLREVERHVAYVVTETGTNPNTGAPYTRHKFFKKDNTQLGEPLYTRELFVTAGWCDKEAHDWEQPGKYDQPEPIKVKVSERPDGKWVITWVEDNPWVKMFNDGALEEWEQEQKAQNGTSKKAPTP